MSHNLSVIIPAYNEVDNYYNHKLNHVYTYLKKQPFPFELILVDDGSTDQTPILLRQFSKDKPEVSVMVITHQGKAGAVKSGMLSAKGDYRLFTDFDQSTPIEEVDKMIPLLDQGYDVVIGSREVKGSLREKEPWFRHLMGKGFNFGVQLIAIRGIKDTQCGFKIFSRQAAIVLFSKIYITTKPTKKAFTGAFDVELLFLAKKLKYIIAEVPVKWRHEKSNRVNPLHDSLIMALQVIKIRLAYMMKKYHE